MIELITLIALLVPVVSGLAAWNIVARRYQVDDAFLFSCGKALCVGFAFSLHAFVCQLLLLFGLANFSSVILVDFLLMCFCLAIAINANQSKNSITNDPNTNSSAKSQRFNRWMQILLSGSRISKFAGGILISVCFVLVLFVYFKFTISPLGDWDAWIIWNTKARLLYESPEHWLEPLRALDWWHHPDYPLTHSASVARLWFWATESRFAPLAQGLIYPGLCLLLIFSSLIYLRDNLCAIAAGFILLASPVYHETFWAQCADGPLAFFMLASCVSLLLATKAENPSLWWSLSAMAAGIAPSIKNEGLAWWAVLLIALSIYVFLVKKEVDLRKKFYQWIFISTALATIAISTKFIIGSENDLLQEPRDITNLLLDWHRHFEAIQVTLSRWAGTLPDAQRDPGVNPVANHFQPPFAALALITLMLVGLFGRNSKSDRSMQCLLLVAIGCLILIEHFIFVTTPHELSWHLFSAAHRLVAQMWPSVVFLIFLSAGKSHDHQELDASAV